ncbi:kinase-like domain-containing protein [Glomus cerebriforme]|uniref:Kinase-like domain-containing protein n=1 Tax=Glomus cerebriforme TaxID=658196 RepID=A0A397T0J1_9GLOM|nr:kinase-like domain-containing protein [Glomus cerebriforme]
MSAIKCELFFATINKAHASLDYNIHNNLIKQHEFRKQKIVVDDSLTKVQKSQMIKLLNKNHDRYKVIFNEGTKRTCENCGKECLATLYCEYCIRQILEANFLTWTSENDDIDDLIQKCQLESMSPNRIIEWIPYDNLQNIVCLTKGIYSADWSDGCYDKWDSKERKLTRSKPRKVILKRLENVENANKSWFEEAKSCLITSNRWNSIVKYYGLTKDLNGNYFLIMKNFDANLRNYLYRNHDRITWKERIEITSDIIRSLLRVHNENSIHRNLHSRNILYKNYWHIGDLGFCGPADKPLDNIYGTLPYVAPEIITGKESTYASDIYSLAMLMWEISSGHPPFINYKHDDSNFAIDIINGMRPDIVQGTPLDFKELMEQCWNADPMKRPNINTLFDKINEMNKVYQTNKNSNKNTIHIRSVNPLVRNLESKIYNIKDLFKQSQDIVSKNKIEPYDSPMLIDDEEEINKTKRIYSEISDGNENDDVIVKHKRMK